MPLELVCIQTEIMKYSNQSDHASTEESPFIIIDNLKLYGASWDVIDCCLSEQNPNQIVCDMPPICFTPKIVSGTEDESCDVIK